MQLSAINPGIVERIKFWQTQIILTIALLSVFSCQISFAQPGSLNFRNITMEDGLSNNSVLSITQDSQGFMWFGTLDGLNRYDGYRIKVYENDPDDPDRISFKYVMSIFEDSKGILWIGTGFRGLKRYDKERDRFISYRLDANDSTSISSNHFIEALYEDKQGDFWIGTMHGLNKYDAENDRFIRYTNTIVDSSGIRPEYITCIFEDSKDNFWLGTKGGGLILFDRESRTALRFKHDPGNSRSINNNYISSIFEDECCDLWVGTDKGYNRLKYVQEELFFEQHKKGLPPKITSKKVLDLYERMGSSGIRDAVLQADYIDNQGNIWIGTLYGGVKFYNTAQNVFHTYKFQSRDTGGLNNRSVMALYERSDGNLWIGVDHGGLHLLNRKTNSFTHYPLNPEEPDDPFDENITDIEEDSYGNLWISTWTRGAYKIDLKSGRSTHYTLEPDNPSSLNCPILYTIYEDRRKQLWIGTYGKGLSLYDRENDCFIASTEIYQHFVRKFYEDSQGNLWIGTNPGLFLYNRESKTFKEWLSDPNDNSSLSNPWISAVIEDRSNNLWIGTFYGLNRFDRENDIFETFTKKDGLADNNIHGILEDEKGHLWVSTNYGLSKFDPVNKTFKNYDVNDGLQGDQFNPNACVRTQSGELIFGGTNGFTLFHPDSIKDIESIPPVVLTDFRVFNKTVSPGDKKSPLQTAVYLTDEILLSHHQHSISFEFAVLDFINPKNNKFKYILEGFNKDWIETDADHRVATFTNLDPGEYVFRVLGANNKGIWNTEGVSIKIVLTPPWYQTLWAYLLYALFTIALVYFFWRAQLRRIHLRNELKMKQFEAQKLHELDQLKSRFFTNISHEIRTPLALILGPLEQLFSEASKEKRKKYLQMMYRNSQQLLRMINQLLDFSKFEAGQMYLKAREVNLVPFLKGITYSFSSLAERLQISLIFHCDQEKILAFADQDKLDKILTNLLSNAFKFTGQGGKISVLLSHASDDRIIEIQVKDTGKGIAAEHLDHIFDRYYQTSEKDGQTGTGLGLALVKELTEIHHGRITVRSEPGKGSSFVIQLPLGRENYKSDEILMVGKAETFPVEPIPENFAPPAEDVVKAPHCSDSSIRGTLKKNLPIILIVDDTEDVRTYIRGLLEADYQCIEALDGADGFKNALEKMPDFIISDVMMPHMNGFQLCDKLKTDERTSHIPVILLTARASEGSKLQGLETGADDYLVKPFSARELLVRVTNIIEQRRKLRERFTRESYFSPKEITVTSADERFLARAIEIIENNMNEPGFGVDLFGKQMGLSHSQLHRKIQALTNHSPVEFIRIYRLKRAASLLTQKFGNISEIAYEVGFSNPAYFAECFRKQYGKSPSEYAKQS
jgi:signal transduction histidine kinase/ligand-binding sensor domain-containing protein/DNA-binding response OmpR family regulator